MHITEPLPGEKSARLVFGLDWRAYPAKGGRAERRRYADDFGATHYLEYRVGTELIGGFAAPDASEVRGAKLYSGAARVALHGRIKSKPAALVLLQDDQRVHVVFVVRGVVRNDEVLKLEEAQARRLEIEQECLRLNLPLTTLGAGPRIGDVYETFAASALLADRKLGRVAKLPVSVPTLVPIVAIIAAAAFGGGKLMDALSPPPPPPHEPTYQERYAAEVRRVFHAPLPRASALAPALLDELGPGESVRAGWLFEKATCSTAGDCIVAGRRHGGSFADFDRVATPAMRPVIFNPDGLHLTFRGPAVPKVASVSLQDSKNWPAEQQLIDMLQTPPQRLSVRPFEIKAYGYTVRIDPAKLLLPPPPGTAAPGANAHLVRQGTWQIEGFRWQAVLLSRLPSSMALDSLTLELRLKDQGTTSAQAGAADEQVGVHFTAKGKYYVLN
ncbi:hypothetical protein [Paraburkholderia sp. BL10I2N1]|uniref:hypothetical protein n=1 Tax=Paraburkholderia sp. BL10I2N1 TaxID=1938796 RepID=UPI00105C7208|nr:hypothetical protein [Paraburkholderia sp. BL10I2N1]TDN59095.1 hypothetical protein B0G77_8284 [Paraburkholderia sp. BL10I2N1]